MERRAFATIGRGQRGGVALVCIVLGLAIMGCASSGSDASSAAATPAATPAHWAYEGAAGPSNWGDLDPAYAACSDGRAQSPIDIAGATSGDLPDIDLAEGSLSPVGVINNGHTIQVDAPPGNTITVGGETYELAQFHFHTPSEHAIDGTRQAMELHLVHRNADGRLAVLGVLLEEGAEHAALAPVFDSIPATTGAERSVDAGIDLAALLPDDRSTYRYDGSLTTPPCSEGVAWIVFAEPMTVSTAQLEAFRSVLPANARPLQPANGRTLVEGS
jgi:carbonic anhydrase